MNPVILSQAQTQRRANLPRLELLRGRKRETAMTTVLLSEIPIIPSQLLILEIDFKTRGNNQKRSSKRVREQIIKREI